MFEIYHMNVYRCLGGIKNVNSEELHHEMINIIPDIKGRPRLFGYDIEFDDGNFSFYINTYDEKEYQIDICVPDEAFLFHLLHSLKEALIKLQAVFNLVYFIENEDGEQISDDFYIDTFNYPKKHKN